MQSGKNCWISPSQAEEPIEQHHCDLALAMQQVTEEAMLRWSAMPETLCQIQMPGRIFAWLAV
jgi:hypothetical protein